MENRTLSKQIDNLTSTLGETLISLRDEIEELEGKRDKLQEQVDTLEGALASATEQISELQKQINDRD